jgi:hypothetical protein
MDRLPSGRFKVAGELELVVFGDDGLRHFHLEQSNYAVTDTLASYSPESDRNAVKEVFMQFMKMA